MRKFKITLISGHEYIIERNIIFIEDFVGHLHKDSTFGFYEIDCNTSINIRHILKIEEVH